MLNMDRILETDLPVLPMTVVFRYGSTPGLKIHKVQRVRQAAGKRPDLLMVDIGISVISSSSASSPVQYPWKSHG